MGFCALIFVAMLFAFKISGVGVGISFEDIDKYLNAPFRSILSIIFIVQGWLCLRQAVSSKTSLLDSVFTYGITAVTFLGCGFILLMGVFN